MKTLIAFLGVFFLSSYTTQAQERGAYQRPIAQFGFNFSEIYLPALSFELTAKLDEQNDLGLNLGWPGRYFDNYDELEYSFESGIFHRYILKKQGQHFYFLKHGLRWMVGSFWESRSDWYAYEENGDAFLVYETRDFNDIINRFNYTIAIGAQFNSNNFFVEFNAGLRYSTVYESSNLQAPLSDNAFNLNERWLYEGFSPVLAIIIGLQFPDKGGI